MLWEAQRLSAKSIFMGPEMTIAAENLEKKLTEGHALKCGLKFRGLNVHVK